MKTIKFKSLAVLLAVLLLVFASIGTAYAYFSDYDTGRGYATLKLSAETTIDEGTDPAVKNIVIYNAENSAPVVVRVGIFGPEGLKVTVPSGWTKAGDFYYYNSVLAPGENTGTAIEAKIELTPEQQAVADDSFNVTVVHESAVAVYNEDGTVKLPEGWDSVTIK